MKDKIIMLVIGILIGAIIASGCFLIFNKKGAEGKIGGGERPDKGNFTPGDMSQGRPDSNSNQITNNNEVNSNNTSENEV